MENKTIKLSTTQIIAGGFFVAILIGSILLSLPIASSDGQATSYIDALFTATTSVCVTGLVVVNTYSHWSLFGQVVILILIQCGGLGLVTFSTFFMMIIGKKVTLKDRLLIQDAFNLNSLSGLVKFTKRVLIGTFTVEGCGVVLYSLVYVKHYGLAKGLWISVFNAVSAFCNAGMDVMGPNSLADYVGNPLINITTMSLIICGGLGFIVWWDLIDVGKLVIHKEIKGKFFFSKLSLHSKLVLVTTAVLILTGAVVVFVLEFNNPNTLGALPIGDKIWASFFQSVTLRTAGFFTISQKGMHEVTALVCMVYMFIGGSPVGTAGGIKTIAFALIVLTIVSVAKASEDTTAFKRTISRNLIKKTLAVASISIAIVFLDIVLLSGVSNGSLADVMYEAVSALGTVGLSRDFTANLNIWGKIIIISAMFLGRVGPITMAIAFSPKKSKNALAKYPKEEVIIG